MVESVFLLNSQDLEFYFELSSEYDGFDRDLNRIDADFGHSIVEAFRIHGKGDWEVYMYSRNGRKDFLDAYTPTVSQDLVKSVETRLELPNNNLVR